MNYDLEAKRGRTRSLGKEGRCGSNGKEKETKKGKEITEGALEGYSELIMLENSTQ